MNFNLGDSLNFMNGTTAAANPVLRGTVLRDEIRRFDFPSPINGPAFSIEGQDRVVQSSTDSSLHYYFRVRRVSPIGDPTGSLPAGSLVCLLHVHRMVRGTPSPVDIDWRPDGVGSLAPTWAAYGGQSGGIAYVEVYFQIGGRYGDTVGQAIPGDGSRFVYIALRPTDPQRYEEVDQGLAVRVSFVVPGGHSHQDVLQRGFTPYWRG
jgi:hypothetical protein